MSADYQGLATKGFKGLKIARWYARTLALNMLRRGLILGRYSLACWQKQKVNKAMRRLGEQFFQALEQGETNPLVVSAVSDAVKKAKDLKEVKDKNYQAVAAIREKIQAAWAKEPPPAPAPTSETPPPPAEPTEAAEKPEEPAAS
jgi:lysozyme family protein